MEIDIQYRPSATAVRIGLQPKEAITAEAGAMICMSPHISVATTTHKKGQGSILRSVKRLFAGESFFLNHFEAETAGEVWLSTPLPGDLVNHKLKGGRLIIQSGSFLACGPGINIDVGWQGFKNLFSGESMFWLNAGGQGPVIMSSFGAIHALEVEGELIVDTGYIVAFEDTLNFRLSKAGSSWLQSILGGEGIVCRFQGRGKVWVQSHSSQSFGKQLTPHLRPRQA